MSEKDYIKITRANASEATEEILPSSLIKLQDALVAEARRLNMTAVVILRPDEENISVDGTRQLGGSLASRSGFLPACISKKLAELFFVGTATPLNALVLYAIMTEAEALLKSGDTDTLGAVIDKMMSLKNVVPSEDIKSLEPLLRMLTGEADTSWMH